MNLIARDSGGGNIVAREMATPTWYPPATVDPVAVEIFRRDLDEAGRYIGAPISLGRFSPDADIWIPNNPATDRNARFFAISYAADGTPDVSSLDDAVNVTALFRRETAAPTVTLIDAATNTSISLAVDGFTKFAIKRKVRRSASADMSGATTEITNYTGQEMPRVVELTREAAPAAQTIYVRISHSSGGAFGAESPAQPFTFTATDGTGGSSGGGGGYYKRDPY